MWATREYAMAHVSSINLTRTLYLTETSNGFWLYDYTRGMNLSMRAKTAQDAFVEALSYYQNRLTDVEQELQTLKSKVEAFVEDVHKCPDDQEG
jgi:hypothetical protein